MALDPSIALQVRGPADPLESLGKAMSLKSLATQQRLQEAQFAKYEQDQAAEQKLNDLYRGNIGPDGQVNRAGVLSGAAGAGLGSRIPGLQKGFAETDKAAADAKNVNSQIGERDYGVLKKKQEAASAMLGALYSRVQAGQPVTQDDVIRGLQGMVASGAIDDQQAAAAMRELPGRPEQIPQFLQEKLLASVEAGKRLEALTPKFEKVDAGNRVVTGTTNQLTGQFTPQGAPITKAPEGYTVGQDGGLTVDPGFLSAKKQIAQAGKSVTNVSVNTGQKGFENELKMRGDFKAEPVYKAHQEMQSAHAQIKQALGKNSPVGDLAGATKIMKLLDPGSVVRESELGMAMAASGLMDRVENYATNILNGTKLTPTQRKEFQSLADSLYSESVKSYNSKLGEYKSLGAGYGLDADRALGAAAELPKEAAPKKGVVQDGYVFMGGDPANPQSWKRAGK